MTPEEKSKEIIDMFYKIGLNQRDEALESSVLHVTELLEELYDCANSVAPWIDEKIKFYKQVKLILNEKYQE
jgi:hypothetical protein